ncbi:Eukaryotic translation initiation factor 3 subunit J [Rhizophlyctis rosea]|uniref:Eukaryotic translation initiation factor 3 subunit J n=1 Tax=Rhizophlyctis rosea TaxID=64517 RepID=A0AAD5SCQ2_9FUNG|nr:Eukaryotic translation initiation factor 3 subunit J [Rhizophlyctis rosea]
MADEWDDEDVDVKVTIPVPSKGQWDDEDAEDEEVKVRNSLTFETFHQAIHLTTYTFQSSWEDSDEEVKKPAEEEKNPATSPTAATPAPKKKKGLAAAIAARKEEEEKKRAELAAKKKNVEAEEEDDYETPEEKKARLRKQVMEADFENTKALFGVSTPAPTAASKIESSNPSTKPEFDEYIKVVMEKFSSFEKSPQYSYFVENLLRDLLVPLNVDDTRRISSSITAMVNEKQKAAKDAGKKKKGAVGKKSNLQTGPKGLDTTNYDDTYDDFDDFM